MRSSTGQFPALDTIRGFGFLLVLISHIGNARNFPTRGMGQFGVWIFFVLSAFLLSRPFFADPGRIRRVQAWKAYFFRRALRIFPPLVAALIAFHFVSNWDWRMVAENLFFIRGTDAIWTVFIEVRYYVILPLAVALIVSLSFRRRLFVFLLLVGLTFHVIDAPFWRDPATWFARSGDEVNAHTFLQYLPVFVAGTLLAWISVKVSGSKAWTGKLRKVAAAGVISSLVALIVLSPAIMGEIIGAHFSGPYYAYWWTPLLPISCSLVFFSTLATGGVAAFLAHPLCRALGKISYSGYLSHGFYVNGFRAVENRWLYIGAVIVSSFVTATLGYMLLEKPFMRMGRPRA